MKILILSTSDPYKSAGIVAKDMFDGFKKAGHQVKLLVRVWGNYKDKNILPVDSKPIHFYKRLIKRGTKYLNKVGLFRSETVKTDSDYHVQDIDQTFDYYSTRKILKKAGFNPDVIMIVFAQNFLNAKNIYELNKLTGAPVFWQIVDMASFTGLCHYAWDCNNYTRNCGRCPALFSLNERDTSFKNLNFKKNYIQKTNLNIVIGSDWLISRAKKSAIFKGKKISKVFLSLNSNDFLPQVNREQYLSEFRIPSEHFIISFGAMNLAAKRKGIKYIKEALAIVDKAELRRKILVIYAGDRELSFDCGLNTKYLGVLDRNDLPKLYHCSDLFISASLQDVGPYTMIEALMCGVPVVSFNTGFANDFIRDDQTGYLTKANTSDELAKGILRFEKKSNQELNDIKQKCYHTIKDVLSIDKQIDSYLKLFKEGGVIN